MAKIEAFQISGFIVEFHTGDREHPPPHFHLSPNDETWEIRVWFGLSGVDEGLKYNFVYPKTGHSIPSSIEQKILANVIDHMNELQEQWERTR